ncbi:MAG: sulfatase-like hydrolase/transferase [Opitutaceae bacterium]|nr:sulfatase-like hydrolase/transferase [Opitutaceae bacterium]
MKASARFLSVSLLARRSLGVAGSLFLSFSTAAAPTAVAAETRRPNVVVLLADDAGWGDYGANGNTTVRTPHIDSIARGGVIFDRFFVQPLCAPTRAEFLTGRYFPRAGVTGVSTGQERMELDEKTVADAFQAAGYATGAFGKWHNGSQWPHHPMARGFDEYFGHTSGHWGEYFDAPLEHNGRMVRTEGYIVDVCTDRALDFIARHRTKPFFCYVPFTTPHTPWGAPAEDWARYKDLTPAQHATDAKREDISKTRCALAMIENQDRNVGRILARLNELGLAENTIVFFFSDNGPNTHRWNGGMKNAKGSTDEGGVRAPGFLRWPARIAPGRTVPEIAAAIDLLPTLTSLAGIPRVGTKPLDGRDLSPLLLGGDATAWPERLLVHSGGDAVSVRAQRHRLDAQGKLFDLATDPGQTTPLNDREPALTAQLTQAAQAYRAEVLATVPNGAPRPRPERHAVDPRPLDVGHRAFPITMLPARDGEPQGGAKRSGFYPNSSYFVNWTSLDDRLVWNVEVQTEGRYAVTIDYTVPLPDAGSTIELSFNGARLTGKVAPGWDPPLYTNQDTLPRPDGESQMKEFHPLALGEIALPRGPGALTLRALEIPGRSVMDVRRLTLTLLP